MQIGSIWVGAETVHIRFGVEARALMLKSVEELAEQLKLPWVAMVINFNIYFTGIYLFKFVFSFHVVSIFFLSIFFAFYLYFNLSFSGLTKL